MPNWLSDGWTTEEWDAITELSDRLMSSARDFDAAVGGGGGGLPPAQVFETAERLLTIAHSMGHLGLRP